MRSISQIIDDMLGRPKVRPAPQVPHTPVREEMEKLGFAPSRCTPEGVQRLSSLLGEATDAQAIHVL